MNHRFKNVVIRASAGTGKTFQLSNRYIGLVAAGVPLDTILATTFTRKAAGEILDRVVFRLADAALDADKLADLAQHAGIPGLDRERCLTMLRSMLHQLHRLRISTLDSFFIQVARSFSLELGLPPGWRIVDEVDDRRLRDEAIRAVLADESTGDVVKLMSLLTKGQAARSVSSQIRSVAADLYGLYLEAPPDAWHSLTRLKKLEAAKVEAAIEVVTAVELPADKRFAKARQQDVDNATAAAWDTFLAKGLAAKVFAAAESYYRKPISAEIQAAYEPLIRHAKAVLIDRVANQTEATHGLLERFDVAYQRLKLSQRGLRFEDVTRRLAGRQMAGALDGVVYRLDARVAHLLLDEFQDTAPLQWQVLRPFARRITGQGDSRGADREETQTAVSQSFFCVGDVKQAIYGWRGGVAEIFEAVHDELPGLTSGSLDKSWRSAPAVIDTVNRVFGETPSNSVLQRYPAAAGNWAKRFGRHTTALGDLLGHCRLEVAPEAAEGQDPNEQTLIRAADLVEELSRRAAGLSIGVLVRRNKTVARLIYELRLRNVQASEEGGNPLTDSPAVALLLSLFTLADHPGHTAARFHLAGSPLADELALHDPADDRTAWRLATEIRRSLSIDGYGPTTRGWAQRLAPQCNARDLNRLAQLVELAYAYEARATERPEDFVTFTAGQRVEDPTAADVRVMTVHQAKGLEFEIVVAPELDVKLVGQTPRVVQGRPGPTRDIQRVCRYVGKDIRALLPEPFVRMFEESQRRDVEESLCLLYVAMTRAVHSLRMIIAGSTAAEKQLPATFAGVLRAALAPNDRAEPGATLFEHGDPAWLAQMPLGGETGEALAERSGLARVATSTVTIRLAEAPRRSSRRLERRSPSQLEGGPRVELAGRLRLDTSAALDWGTGMHGLFERIKWLEDGLPDDDVLAEQLGRLCDEDINVERLLEHFHRSLGHPSFRRALSRRTYLQPASGVNEAAVHADPAMQAPRWQVYCERSFAIRDGGRLLNGFIDRLVVLFDGDHPMAADIIDYKTDTVDAADPARLAERVEVYRPQLAAYRRAVTRMYGLAALQVSARLLFTGPGEVIAVAAEE